MAQRRDEESTERDLADALAEDLGTDAETIRRDSDAVDLPPPWNGEITDPVENDG
jgi:hypothetical protein